MKTATITLESVKCTDGWYELGLELGLSGEEIGKVFEYGEYGTVEIVVNEKLEIVGGRVIPCGRPK
jgi:hypothetical protein